MDLSNNKDYSAAWKKAVLKITQGMVEQSSEEYAHRGIQGRILSKGMYLLYTQDIEKLQEVIDLITEVLSDGEYAQVDLAIRALTGLIEQIDNEAIIKEFHPFVPSIISALLSAFTNEDIGSHGRQKVLHVFYLCLRTISWADGIDNELIESCLGETFNQWMAIFLQVIQT